MLNERNIKNFIVLTPLLGVILTSFILTKLFISEVKSQYKTEVQQLLIDEEIKVKEIVKNRIDNIISLLEKDYNQQIEAEKEDVKNIVDIAYNIIKNTYNKNKDKSKDLILSEINNQLRDLRFYENLSGYYFIFSDEGTTVLHPPLPHLEGINYRDYKDNKAKNTINKFINFLDKNDYGYITWEWYKPQETTIKQKIGYLKKFKPLNIFVGSAKYNEDVEEHVKNKLQELLNTITYDKNNYIFAYDKLGNTISHIKKELIGKNRFNLSVEGRLLIQEIINTAFNTKGSYISYLATINPLTKQPSEKISYIKLFKKTNWAIGTGMYNSIMLNNIKKKQLLMKENLDYTISKVIEYSFLITIFSMIIMTLISRKVGNIINIYKNDLKEINNTLEIKVKNRTKELENSKNKLKEMALRDPLTNLYNRRYFEHTIEKLISLAIRRKEKLCLLMLDIDKFKNINDTYGHDIGDEVLKKLADNLLELLRNSDVITRIGGEEFAIVFPNTPIEAGYQTADKIRKVIENLKIEVKKDILINFTVSIGITLFDENKDKDVHSLLKRADIALYEAKDSGRNKVVIFNEKK